MRKKLRGASILSSGVLKVVGSTRYRKPRDLDMVLVISDRLFKQLYALTPHEFLLEGATGKWSVGRWRWAAQCTTAGKVLERRIKAGLSKLALDLKILPESVDLIKDYEHKQRQRRA